MTQIICSYLDKLSEYERKGDWLSVAVSIMHSLVCLFFGLGLMAVGFFIAAGAFTEIVNKIFF